jgi:hypothetical protein
MEHAADDVFVFCGFARFDPHLCIYGVDHNIGI